MSPETATKSKKLNLLEGLTLPNVFKWLGITLLVFVLFTLTYLYAIDPFQKPSDVRVTNLSDRSATISWVTEKPSKGIVIYGEDSSFMPGILASVGQEIAYDDRDVAKAVLEGAEELEGNLESRDQAVSSSDLENNVKVTTAERYYVHHVTVKNLDPNTEYFFRIGDGVRFVSAEGDFAEDEFTAVSESDFTTFPDLEKLQQPDPTYGKIVSDDERVEVVNDAVIFLKTGLGSGSVPQSTVMNEEGNWYIDISNIRDLDVPVNVLTFDEEEDSHSVFVEAGEFGESLHLVEPMYADAPMVDITVSNDWEEEGNQTENSFIFKSFAAKDDKENKEEKDPKKYNENGKIKKTYAEQVKRRLARGDGVNLSEEDIAALKNDRGVDVEALKPKKQETATSGGGSVCSNTSGQPYNTGVVDVDGENYYAYCCSNGYHVPANCDANGNNCQVLASQANTACQTRYQNQGVVGLNGGVQGNGNIGIPCKLSNGEIIYVPDENQCDKRAGDAQTEEELEEYNSEVIWCTLPTGSQTLLDRESCNEIPGSNAPSQSSGSTGGSEYVNQNPSVFEGNRCNNPDAPIRQGRYGYYYECKNGKWTKVQHNSVSQEGSTNAPFVCKITRVVGTEIKEETHYVSSKEECDSLSASADVVSRDFDDEGCFTEGARTQGNTLECRGGKWIPIVNENTEIRYVEIGCKMSSGTGYVRGVGCGDRSSGTTVVVAERPCPNGNSTCVCDDGSVGHGSCDVSDVEDVAGSLNIHLEDGDKCPAGEVCFCEGGQYEILTDSDECKVVSSSPQQILSEVHAQSSIVISPEKGVFAIEQSGVYCAVYNAEDYCFNIATPGEKFLYIDTNSNGEFDSTDVNISSGVNELSIDLEVKNSKFSLKSGFNLVSFDFVNAQIGTTAKEWLTYLNEKYNGAFYSIAKFESGKWIVIENRNNETYGTDNFQIMPGAGYLLKSKYDMNLSLGGKAVIDPVPVKLQPGWNLISINGNSAAYTAESLIDDVNILQGVVSDNVTKWDTSLSRYVGLEKEASAVYGLDYPLTSTDGYFLRVKQGSGVWTPQ